MRRLVIRILGLEPFGLGNGIQGCVLNLGKPGDCHWAQWRDPYPA
jgi:hypothetical protein